MSQHLPLHERIVPPAKDTIEYTFYDDLRHLVYSAKPGEFELAAEKHFRQLLQEIQEYVRQLSALHKLDDYVWYHTSESSRRKNDLLSLHITRTDNNVSSTDFSSSSFSLQGTCCFGDNLDDEWLIVWMCFQVSARFPLLSLTLRDFDGEFLLIETAQHLPEWADPSTTLNRVFIRGGRLYLIPQQYSQETSSSTKLFQNLTITQALTLLSKTMDTSWALAPEQLRFALHNRLDTYPALSLDRNRFQARCFLPYSLARLFEAHPEFVSEAVQAFCFPEPDDVDPSSVSRVFGLHECPQVCSKDCLVPVSVRFTRCRFAQVNSRRLQESEELKEALEDPRVQALELGVKLMNGAEILYARGQEGKCETSVALFEFTNGVLFEGDYFREGFEELVQDDLEWMQVSEEDLQEMMDPYMIRPVHDNEDLGDYLVDSFKGFLGAESMYDGIQISRNGVESESDDESLDEIDCNFTELMQSLSLAEGPGEGKGDAIAQEWFEGVRDMQHSLEHGHGNKEDFLFSGFPKESSEDVSDSELDEHLLKNLMASFQAQQGETGPSSNIFQSLGINISQTSNRTENKDHKQ